MQSPPAKTPPRVGLFCPTFLKPEMLHVYRQVAGLERVSPVILAFKIENSARFPFQPIRIVRRSPMRWARRIWNVQIRKIPQRAYPSEMRSLASILADERCRLVHIYFGNNGLFWLPYLQKATIPTVVSFHGADVQVGVGSKGAKRLFSQLFSAASLLLARSESLSQSLQSLGCPPGKIRIQRTGIPLGKFFYKPRSEPRDGGWRLIQACRLIEKKGLETTLKAFALFARRYPKSSLTIAGEGPLRQRLESVAESLGLAGKVGFPGFLAEQDLIDLYHGCHLFLHPSERTPDGDREGIPNSLLEAMATGLPSIATRHGGIPEAITHLKSGLLVEEGDSKAIAEALELLAENGSLREFIGKTGAETIRKEFDLSVQIDRLENIYLELLDR